MVAASGKCLCATAIQTAGTIQMKHLNCVPPNNAQGESSDVTMVLVSGKLGHAMAITTALTSLMKQKSTANLNDVALHSLSVLMEHAYQQVRDVMDHQTVLTVQMSRRRNVVWATLPNLLSLLHSLLPQHHPNLQ